MKCMVCNTKEEIMSEFYFRHKENKFVKKVPYCSLCFETIVKHHSFLIKHNLNFEPFSFSEAWNVENE